MRKSELDGFTVFRPPLKNELHISVRRRTIGLSIRAYEVIGSDWVNIFFDERKNRVMIKRAEASYPNTLKICNNGKSGRVINSLSATDKLRRMFGKDARVAGHEAGDGILIFEEVRR